MLYIANCGLQLPTAHSQLPSNLRLLTSVYLIEDGMNELLFLITLKKVILNLQNIYDKFIELMSSFEKNEVEYILIGGLAINLHGFARNTEDIDLFIRPTKNNVDQVCRALMDVFDDNEIYEITLDELNKYAVIRYGTDYGFCIDLIAKIGTEFNYKDMNFEIKTIDNVKIKVANIETLYRLKENTHREIDQLDLKFLKSKMNN